MEAGTHVATNASILEVGWQESPALQQVGVEIEHLTGELSNLEFVAGLAAAIATDLRHPNTWERAHVLPPALLNVQFGSPLFVSIGLVQEVALHAASMAFLIYGLKRIWGIDLELRTHREEMRERFHRAQLNADRAQRRIERAASDFDRDAFARVHSEVDQAQHWGDGVSAAPDSLRKTWTGAYATWQIDDTSED